MANMLETSGTTYSPAQRAVSLTIGVAFGLPLTSVAAMANGMSMPTQMPTTNHWASHSASTAAQAVGSSSASLYQGHQLSQATTLVHTSNIAALGHLQHATLTAALLNSGTLNLASSKLSFLAGNLANFSSLTIDVGGRSKVVNLDTKLTAAEIIAAEQVLSGAGQTIAIGADGAADGGKVVLNNSLLTAINTAIGAPLSSLTIARGVQVVDNLSSLSLSGNLANYGSILTASSTSGSTDTISAANVVNARGGAISSYTTGGGLYGADVSLNASTSLTNSGLISSANNLNISAPVVSNVGAQASILAGSNVNITAATVNNTGTVAAANGNVNLASLGALTLNGTGGTIQAYNGNVNFATNNADIAVNGGNVLSEQVNYTAGTGNVNANMDEATGVVNAAGNNVHVYANTDVLKLGTIDAANDPLIVNTSGSVDLANTAPPIGNTNGAPLTVIAAGNIFDSGAAMTLNTSSTTAAGGALTLIAGATVTGTTNTNATVTKGSTTGGTIDLTGTNLNNDGSAGAVAINTTSSAAALGSVGGNVQLIAFAGKNVGSGEVYTSTINTSSTNFAGGNVTIIAGAKTGTAINTGAITATGNGVGGLITADASTPIVTVTTKGVTGVTFGADGGQTANVFAPTKTPNVANIIMANINSNNGVNISTGGNASIANTSSDLNLNTVAVGKTGVLNATDSSAANNVVVTGVVTGGTANITASGNVESTGVGSVNTTNLNLTHSGLGAVALSTDVTNLNLQGTTLTINQGTATLNLSGNVNNTAASLNIAAGGQLNISAPLFINGDANIGTLATSKGGLAVNANVFSTNGFVLLEAGGKGALTEAKGVTVSSSSVGLASVTAIGTKALPFNTDVTSSLQIEIANVKGSAYVSDSNYGALTLQASPAIAGGSLFLTSNSSALTVQQVNFNNVSITDLATGKGNTGVIVDGSGNIGTGLGTVTINSAAGISQTANTSVIQGTTVTLGATAPVASVGTDTANPIYVSSANLALTAAQGNVYVSDNLAATVNGSASLTGTFSVTDNGVANAKTGDSLTVGKSVTGGTIDLSTTAVLPATPGSIAVTGTVGTSSTNTVNIDSGNGLTTKGTILGSNINLTTAAGPVAVGGKVGDTTSALTFTSGSLAGITVTSILTGNNITLDATAGPVTTKAAINGSGPNSSVTINGTSATATGNAVVIGAAITGSSINLGYADSKTGQGNIAVNSPVGNTSSTDVVIAANSSSGAGGSLTGTGLISGSNVTLTAADSIGTAKAPINTAAGVLSANQTSTATGAGAFITQKGNINLGNSIDNNLVVKATGTFDVTGTVAAPNYTLTSTGNFTIDGTVENTTGAAVTKGTQTITSGGNFTISAGALLASTTGSSPVNVTATGVTTVNGTTKTDTLNLNSKGGFNLTSTGTLNDLNDNITTTGPVLVAGTVGTVDRPDNFGLTTTGSFTLAPGISFIGGAKVVAATITNYTDLDGNGNVSLTATGTGNALINYGNITGIDITLTTTNAGGAIFNAPGATIVATQKALQVSAPTINLDTYKVNNQGEISAIGLVEKFQGTLNITSPGALTVTGPTGSFAMNYFSAVNLKAGGAIVVGGTSNGTTLNPFSNFNAANELGTFTVTTPGTFTSPLTGVSVVTNTTGTFGGNIAITASNILYNGSGTAPVFALSATGAGPTISAGKAPVTLDITGSQGLSIGGATGRYTVNVEGYGNTSLSTFTTPGALLINTTSGFNVNYTSLALTGNSRVLITGNLDEGSLPSTAITINTLAASPFLVGGATTMGQTGITLGQGISAGIVTINAPGSVTVGSKTLGATINGSTSVNLNTTALTVNPNSDISGLALNVTLPSTAAAGNLTYTNLNTSPGGLTGYVSASAINLNDPLGSVVLSSGTSGRTILSVGTNPNGVALSGTQSSGGAFTINAQGLTFAAGGLSFNATGGIDGGSVIINLSGISGATKATTTTIGLGAGQISANVADTAQAVDDAGTGQFLLTTVGNIVVNGLNTSQASSSINLGALNGHLGFIANSNGLSPTGSTVVLDGTNINGLNTNLFQIDSSSTLPLMLSGAAAGGNGIISKTPVEMNGGHFDFANTGTIVTSGINLQGVNLTMESATGIDASGNNGFFAFRNPTSAGYTGGNINLDAPFITTAKNGLALQAQGGNLSGATITVTTTMTPIVVAQTITNGGTVANAISFDVGDMLQGLANPNYLAGNVLINSPSALVVHGNGLIFNDGSTINNPMGINGVGGTASLNGGIGSNITLIGATGLVGLNFSTITFNSQSTSAFLLAGASATGNGINGTDANSVLTAGAIVVNNLTAGITTTNEQFVTHSLTLNAPNVTFGAGQVISFEADDNNVGVSGTLGTKPPTGSGGIFSVTTPSFTFLGGGGVVINAAGAGTASLGDSSTGGAISINYTGTTPLKINSSTFAALNVSNAVAPAMPDPPGNLQTSGTINITSATANLIINAAGSAAPNPGGTLFTFGSVGGAFTATAPNISFTNIAALSMPSQNVSTNQPEPGLGLGTITFNSTSATPFTVGGATGTVVNGITDAAPSLIATNLIIQNAFTPAANGKGGGIDMTNGQGINVNNLTLTTPTTVTFAAGGTYAAHEAVNTNAAPTADGTGGTITVNASNILLSGSGVGPTTFDAKGSINTGAGGTVTFNLSGTNAVNIGTGTGQIAFDVSNSGTTTGATAGAVSVTTAGNITANLGAFTYGPFQKAGSGSLTLSGANVLISNVGALNADNLSSITLTSASANDFVFGNAATNGFVDNGGTLTAFGVTINANAAGTLTGGIVTTGGNANATTTVTAQNLTLDTLNTITLGSGVGLTVSADATSGTGGNISLTASGYALSGPTAAPLTANGTGAASGGNIVLNDTGIVVLNLNNTNGIDFSAKGGPTATSSGSVTVASAGNLNVNGDAFTFGPEPAAPSNVGSGTLTLTGANVLLSNVAALSKNPLQSLTINTTSNSDFVFAGAPTTATGNGIVDVGATLTAATFVLNANTAGTMYGGIDATALTTGGLTLAATNITLNTQNAITFAYGATAITAVPVNPGGAGGKITISAGAIDFTGTPGGIVTLTANAGAGGGGGSVLITNAGTGTLTIGTNGFAINATSTVQGGTVTIINGGAIIADGSKINFGGGFKAGAGASFTLNANGVLDLADAANVDLANQTLFSVSSDSAQTFQLGGAAHLANGIEDSNDLQGTTFFVANQGGAIALGTATGISSGSAMTLNAATDIGSALVPIVIDGTVDNQAITVNAGGSAHFNVTGTGTNSFAGGTIIGSLVISSASAGSMGVGFAAGAPVALSARDVTITNTNTNAGALTIGSLLAFDGNLDITAADTSITFAQKAVIGANFGNINVLNTNGGAGANIFFVPGKLIPPSMPGQPPTIIPGAHLLATAPSPLTTQGNITIALDTLTYTPVKATVPANGATIVESDGGHVYFGSTTNPNGSITVADDTTQLQGLGRTLSFNTDTHPTGAINVGAYVQITADPPGASNINTSTIVQSAPDTNGAGAGAAIASSNFMANAVSHTASLPAINTYSLANSASTVSAVSGSSSNVELTSGTSASTATSAINGITNLNSANLLNANAQAGVTLGNSTTSDVSEGGSNTQTGAIQSSTVDTATAQGNGRKLSGGVSNSANVSRRTMDRGSLLLSPLQNEVVDTPFGSVSVAANSVALIVSSDKGLAVFNLHDTHKGAVSIRSGNETIALIPGRSVVVGTSSKTFEAINPAPFVSYRRVSSQNVAGQNETTKVYQADFEILSVLRGLPGVKEMIKADDAKSRAAVANMVKTAAILSQLSATTSSEPYALYLTPELTAYAASAH